MNKPGEVVVTVVVAVLATSLIVLALIGAAVVWPEVVKAAKGFCG